MQAFVPALRPFPWHSPVDWAGHAIGQHRAVWLDGDGATPRGRFSFITWNPHRVLRAWGDRIVDERWDPGVGCIAQSHATGDPLAVLAELLAEEQVEPASPPLPFASGAVLALGFELADWIERLPAVENIAAQAHSEIPDLTVSCYDSVLVFDEIEHRAWIASRVRPGRRPSGVLTTAANGLLPTLASASARAPFESERPMAVGEQGFIDERIARRHAAGVAAIREHLAAGDVYQVNLSWPLRTTWPATPLDLFLAHRRLGRVPHAAFLDLDQDGDVTCFSPERFLACRGRHVSTCPIKGTRPRGETAGDDRRLADELTSSAKDRAEHIMIVDLERNDLGRVCVPGSIRVDPLLAVESFASVHHLVSTVHGTLRSAAGPVDLLRATFPGGSITGAPKIRAIEIIRRLEAEPRRLYTGAIGYWDAGGDLDLAIAIRTALVSRGEIEYRVGGGIVIDSEAAAEYQETLDKARVMTQVLADIDSRMLCP